MPSIASPTNDAYNSIVVSTRRHRVALLRSLFWGSEVEVDTIARGRAVWMDLALPIRNARYLPLGRGALR